jgi:hypothetical protein
MTVRTGAQPRNPRKRANSFVRAKRFRQFIRYFKSYVGFGSVAPAALPIPLRYFNLIPMYGAQSRFMSVYVSLFCFLALGFIFYRRHSIARWMFNNLSKSNSASTVLIAWLPLLLAAASVGLLLLYHSLLQSSISDASFNFRVRGVNLDWQTVLAEASYEDIKWGIPLMASYLGTFVAAELAFAMMAIREYLQDILGLQDGQMLEGR